MNGLIKGHSSRIIYTFQNFIIQYCQKVYKQESDFYQITDWMLGTIQKSGNGHSRRFSFVRMNQNQLAIVESQDLVCLIRPVINTILICKIHGWLVIKRRIFKLPIWQEFQIQFWLKVAIKLTKRPRRQNLFLTQSIN